MHWAVESHIGVLAAILVFSLTLAGIVLRLTPAKIEIARRILAFPLAWALYSIPWALLSLAMHFQASMVLSPLFFALGSKICSRYAGSHRTLKAEIGGISGK